MFRQWLLTALALQFLAAYRAYRDEHNEHVGLNVLQATAVGDVVQTPGKKSEPCWPTVYNYCMISIFYAVPIQPSH